MRHSPLRHPTRGAAIQDSGPRPRALRRAPSIERQTHKSAHSPGSSAHNSLTIGAADCYIPGKEFGRHQRLAAPPGSCRGERAEVADNQYARVTSESGSLMISEPLSPSNIDVTPAPAPVESPRPPRQRTTPADIARQPGMKSATACARAHMARNLGPDVNIAISAPSCGTSTAIRSRAGSAGRCTSPRWACCTWRCLHWSRVWYPP
jgi:hypothetical protein